MKIHRCFKTRVSASLMILPVVSIALFAARAARAADFQLLNPQERTETGCDVRLAGPIEQGDSQRFLDAMQRGRSHWLDGVLCLNSPGGSYQEALRIAAAMLAGSYGLRSEQFPETKEGGITTATVIEPHAKCYSACAIIFMVGNRTGEEDRFFIDRTLNVLGELGFHSPYINEIKLRGESFSKSTVLNAHRAAVNAVRELASLGRSVSYDLMPRDLIVEMLARGPDDGWYMIDTVGKALQFSIELSGYRKPGRPTEQMLCNACNNYLYRKPLDSRVLPLPEVRGDWDCIPAKKYSSKVRFDETDGTEFPFLCEVEYVRRSGKWLITDKSYAFGAATVGFGHVIREWWMHAPDTPIAALAKPKGR